MNLAIPGVQESFYSNTSFPATRARYRNKYNGQWNFGGSNTDGSFTRTVSNSFLSPFEKSQSCRFGLILK